MADFWYFARRILRQRGLLALALLFAALSAGGFGVGLLGLYPVLRNIFPTEPGVPHQTLPDMAAAVGQRLSSMTGGAVALPQAWIDALPASRFDAVLWVVVGLGLLTLLGATANFLHAYFSLTIVSRTVAGVRRDAFHRAVHLPLRSVVLQGPSDLVSRIVYDTQSLGQGFNALLSKALAQITKGAAALSVALYLDKWVALASLGIALPMAVLLRKLGKRIRRASRKALESQAGLYRAAGESLGGLRIVKAHAAERFETGRFHRINKDVVQSEFRVRTARAMASPLIEVLALFILGSFALVAAHAIIQGKLDSKTFLLVLASLGAAAGSLKPLVGLLNDIQQSGAAAQRLRQLLASEPEPGHDRALPRCPSLSVGQTIEFDHVSFTYPGADESSLRDLSLAIPHGQTVAFVGPNGCGKTTLLALIPRLFDPDPGSADGGVRGGRVLWAGRDIREFSVRSLREHIGIVPQETVLFRGSIAFNIGYGASGVTDQRIREAARRARADEFIVAKPGGYAFEVGEGGAGLSGGQRQRIAIARAILRDPQVLILDEATSMVDAESEAKIAEALADFVAGSPPAGDNAPAGPTGAAPELNGHATADAHAHRRVRTCLIVAHRLSTVVAADRIVVMDRGCIVDQGRHDELLERCEMYQSLVNNQLVRVPSPAAVVVPPPRMAAESR